MVKTLLLGTDLGLDGRDEMTSLLEGEGSVCLACWDTCSNGSAGSSCGHR